MTLSDRLHTTECHNNKYRLLSIIDSRSTLIIGTIVSDEADINLTMPLKTWRKYNDSPFEEVNEKWKRTFNMRKHDINKPDAILEWPLYKNNSLGLKLIEMDFQLMFAEKNVEIYEAWEKFIPLIKKYYSYNIKDKASKDLFSKIDYETINSDSIDCIVSLLNAVITPTAQYKMNGKVKKVTIKEAMDCFILQIKSGSSLE